MDRTSNRMTTKNWDLSPATSQSKNIRRLMNHVSKLRGTADGRKRPPAIKDSDSGHNSCILSPNLDLEIKNNDWAEHISNITYKDRYRNLLLTFCGQKEPSRFQEEFPSDCYEGIVRFDSGTYADVYKGRRRSYTTRSRTHKEIVFKVIRAVSRRAHRAMMDTSFSGTETYDDILNEVYISKALSELHLSTKSIQRTHCFPRIISTKVVKGQIPRYFMDDVKNRGADSPERKEPYVNIPGAPLEYVVITMKWCGEPMWKMIKNRKLNEYQLLSIAKQLTFGLAVADHAYKFEHRDLHISNVLIKPTRKAYTPFLIDGLEYQVETCGFRAIIIDTTFSRLSSHDNKVYFKDMSDTLRKKAGSHNEKQSLQDSVYQRMVDETKNNWDSWSPRTNLLWLNYIYKTMGKSSVIKNSEDPIVKKTLNRYSRISNECPRIDDIIDHIVNTSCDH